MKGGGGRGIVTSAFDCVRRGAKLSSERGRPRSQQPPYSNRVSDGIEALGRRNAAAGGDACVRFEATVAQPSQKKWLRSVSDLAGWLKDLLE